MYRLIPYTWFGTSPIAWPTRAELQLECCLFLAGSGAIDNSEAQLSAQDEVTNWQLAVMESTLAPMSCSQLTRPLRTFLQRQSFAGRAAELVAATGQWEDLLPGSGRGDQLITRYPYKNDPNKFANIGIKYREICATRTISTKMNKPFKKVKDNSGIITDNFFYFVEFNFVTDTLEMILGFTGYASSRSRSFVSIGSSMLSCCCSASQFPYQRTIYNSSNNSFVFLETANKPQLNSHIQMPDQSNSVSALAIVTIVTSIEQLDNVTTIFLNGTEMTEGAARRDCWQRRTLQAALYWPQDVFSAQTTRAVEEHCRADLPTPRGISGASTRRSQRFFVTGYFTDTYNIKFFLEFNIRATSTRSVETPELLPCIRGAHTLSLGGCGESARESRGGRSCGGSPG